MTELKVDVINPLRLKDSLQEIQRACEAAQDGNNQQNPDMPSMEQAFLMR